MPATSLPVASQFHEAVHEEAQRLPPPPPGPPDFTPLELPRVDLYPLPEAVERRTRRVPARLRPAADRGPDEASLPLLEAERGPNEAALRQIARELAEAEPTRALRGDRSMDEEITADRSIDEEITREFPGGPRVERGGVADHRQPPMPPQRPSLISLARGSANLTNAALYYEERRDFDLAEQSFLQAAEALYRQLAHFVGPHALHLGDPANPAEPGVEIDVSDLGDLAYRSLPVAKGGVP